MESGSAEHYADLIAEVETNGISRKFRSVTTLFLLASLAFLFIATLLITPLRSISATTLSPISNLFPINREWQQTLFGKQEAKNEAQRKFKNSPLTEFCHPLEPCCNFSHSFLQPSVSSPMPPGTSFHMAKTEVALHFFFLELESIFQPAYFSSHQHELLAEGYGAKILHCLEPPSLFLWLPWESFHWKRDCKNDVEKLLLMSDSPEDFFCGLYIVFLCVCNCLLAWAMCREIHRTSIDCAINMKGVDLSKIHLAPRDQFGLYSSALSGLHCQTNSWHAIHPCAVCLYLKELKSWFKKFNCSKALEQYSVNHSPFSRVKSRDSFSRTYVLRKKISRPFQGNDTRRETCKTAWERDCFKPDSHGSQATEQERDDIIFHNQRKERHFYWVAKTREGRNVKKKVFGKYYSVYRNVKKPDFHNNARKKVQKTCDHVKQTSSWLAVLHSCKFQQLQIRPRLRHSSNPVTSVMIAFSSFFANVEGSSEPYFTTVMKDSPLSGILELFECTSPEVILFASIMAFLILLFILIGTRCCCCVRRNHLQQWPGQGFVGHPEMETGGSLGPSNITFSTTNSFTNKPMQCTTCQSSQSGEAGDMNDREGPFDDSKKEKLREHPHKFVKECNQQGLGDLSSLMATCSTSVVTENDVELLSSSSASITYFSEDVLHHGMSSQYLYPSSSLAVATGTDAFTYLGQSHGLARQRVESDGREGGFNQSTDRWNDHDGDEYSSDSNSVPFVSEASYQKSQSTMAGLHGMPLLSSSLGNRDNASLSLAEGLVQFVSESTCQQSEFGLHNLSVSSSSRISNDNASSSLSGSSNQFVSEASCQQSESILVGLHSLSAPFSSRINRDDASPSLAGDSVQFVSEASCQQAESVMAGLHSLSVSLSSRINRDNAPPCLAGDVKIVRPCSSDITVECQGDWKARVAIVEPQHVMAPHVFPDFEGTWNDLLPVQDGPKDEAPREVSNLCISNEDLFKPFPNLFGPGSPDYPQP